MTSEFEEAEAVEALALERDRCVQGVLEFMAACGVRVTTVPPQLLALLTAYGFHAIGIGRMATHGKRANPRAGVDGAFAEDRSGVLGTLRGDAQGFDEPGVGENARELEPTRRVARTSIGR